MSEVAKTATMITRQQLYFACPHCGDEEAHSVTHFMDDERDHSFGPWQCDECGWEVNGFWQISTKTVVITSLKECPKSPMGYLLLRIRSSKTEKPLWFIVKDKLYMRKGVSIKQVIEEKTYWVDEHTCPTNIVRVEAIIEGSGPTYDDDPHGALEFVAWVPIPEGLDEDEDPDWRVIFPQLGSDIIDAKAETIRVIEA